MIYNRKTNRLKENVKSINMYLNTNENGEGRKEKQNQKTINIHNLDLVKYEQEKNGLLKGENT